MEPSPRHDISHRPLSSLLGPLLVAVTIELDNEFEHRMPHRTTVGPAATSTRGPWLTSFAMWANFLRFVPDDGAPLDDLSGATRIANLAGMIRWRYVDVIPSLDATIGPADGERIVRPTRAGRAAKRIWAPLPALVEERWHERQGDLMDEFSNALKTVATQLGRDLPPFLPVVSRVKTDRTLRGWTPPASSPLPLPPSDLITSLARVLLTFTLDAEATAPMPMHIGANALRVLDARGIPVRDLPRLTGVSMEAVATSVKILEERGHAERVPDPDASRGKIVRLLDAGLDAREQFESNLAATEVAWRARFGERTTDRLREAALAILANRPALIAGLRPFPDGWRAHPPYAGRTAALLRDPVAGLPHYPMVLHRGGYPDGS